MPYKSIKDGAPGSCGAFKDGTTPRADGGEIFKEICQGRKGTPLADEKKTNFCLRKIGIFVSKIKMSKRLGNSAALHCTCTLPFVFVVALLPCAGCACNRYSASVNLGGSCLGTCLL